MLLPGTAKGESSARQKSCAFQNGRLLHRCENLVLYQNVEDAIKCLKPICEASNVMQSNNSSVADGLEAWKGVLKSFRDLGAEGREWLEKTETRYNCSVPAVWFVASILHPKYGGANLTPMEWRTARTWIADAAPEHLAGFTDYVGGESKDAVKAAYESAPGCTKTIWCISRQPGRSVRDRNCSRAKLSWH